MCARLVYLGFDDSIEVQHEDQKEMTVRFFVDKRVSGSVTFHCFYRIHCTGCQRRNKVYRLCLE